MPHTVNGCGTWYYGKKNPVTYQGTCESCNRIHNLSAYTTRLFVVVAFIPIIPLGRKRIIDDCPACRRHRVMKQRDFEVADRRTDDAIAECRKSPTKPDLAKEAMAACVAFRNVVKLETLAPLVEHGLGQHAPTMLLLGQAFEFFGRDEQAERYIRMACQVEDSNETREVLAGRLLSQGKPEEAHPLLQHIIDEVIPDRVDLLFRLAQGYQMKGNHLDALKVFDQCLAVNPLMVKDDVFMQLLEQSKKLLGTTKAIKPREVVEKAKNRKSLVRFGKIAAVVLVIVSIAYAVWSAMLAKNRQVYLVNGLGRSYTASIQGKPYTLQPKSTQKIYLAEGDVDMQITDPAGFVPAERLSLHSPFLSRPFSNSRYVINPDHTAVFLWQKVGYAAGTNRPNDPEFKLAGGQTLQVFESVDHPFEDLPQSVSVERNSVEYRVGLSVLWLDRPNMNAAHSLLAMEKDLGVVATREIAAKRVLLEPLISSDDLTVLNTMMSSEKFADLLRPTLSQRPIHIHKHRFYQSAMDAQGKTEEVEKEYHALLSAEPENADLLYLAGRVTRDRQRSIELYRKATLAPEPCAFGFHAMCGVNLSMGNFQEAVGYAEQALKRIPDVREAKMHAANAYLGAGRLDELLAMGKRDLRKAVPDCLIGAEQVAYVDSLRASHSETDAAIQSLQKIMADWSPDVRQSTIDRLRALPIYVNGNASAWASKLQNAVDPNTKFAVAVSSGKLDEAVNLIKEMQSQEQAHLIVYLAAMQQKRSDIAESELKLAIEELAHAGYDERNLARALKGETIDHALVLQMSERPQAKAVLLAALGTHQPAYRSECFALATKLNFDRRFPHLLVKSALDSSAGQ